MPRYRSILLLALASLCGCRQPGWYPPPEQRPVSEGQDPGQNAMFVRMDDAYANEYIVRDVMAERSEWRWTFVRPEFRFKVHDPAGLKLVMEFNIPPVTFRQTGPVTVTCSVNGQPVGSMRCTRPGRQRFEKLVPPWLVQPESAATVTAEVDRRWVSKDDGAQLSFQLNAIGFTQ